MRKIDDDLKGFESILTEEDIAKSQQDLANREKNKEHLNTGLELISFLENDEKRIETLGTFYDEKVSLVTKFPLSGQMLKEQADLNKILTNQVIMKINKVDSGFFKNLNYLFNSFIN
jgi:hypothetical protein